jgi:pimeloyl-ACP methyl ester carboxylesterase
MKTNLLLVVSVLFASFLWLGHTPSISPPSLITKYANDDSTFVRDQQGLRVHFRDQGVRGTKVIVMLHGNSNSLHNFEPLVALLKDQYRLITLDFPGHGLTGAHPNNQYGYAGLSDALELVMVELDLDNIVLLGHSMGGWVAWRYTVDKPDFVDSLILMSATGMPVRPGDPEPDVGLGFKLLQSSIGPILSAYTMPRISIEKSMDKSTFKRLRTRDQIIDRSWELLRHSENRAALATRAHQGRELDKADLAKKISQPTLLIWGEQDTFVPPSAVLSFSERINNSTTVMLPEVGHLPMLEATAAVAQAIRDFIPVK